MSCRRHAPRDATPPIVFEIAVCAAFEPLGFATQHIGGAANPDGTLDAILGVLGYRVMVECKLNTTPLVRPDIAKREHGPRKRLTVICDELLEAG